MQRKNIAKVTVTAQIRTYAQAIANNPGVSADNKVALGLNPKTSTPSPITPPSTFPALTLQSQTPLQAVIRYRDSAASPSVKAKPYGVTQCQVFGMASATPVTDRSTLPHDRHAHEISVRVESQLGRRRQTVLCDRPLGHPQRQVRAVVADHQFYRTN